MSKIVKSDTCKNLIRKISDNYLYQNTNCFYQTKMNGTTRKQIIVETIEF